MLTLKEIFLTMGKKQLSQPLSLTIRPGEVWGILGGNGSGKSTLLHTLAGLLPVKQGSIFLQDKSLDQYSRKQLAQQIGILFQEYSTLFPQTIYDLCRYARYPHPSSEKDEIIIQRSLITMELDSLRHQFLHLLSGGERKRAYIAGLLSQTPNIYLLDEPTNHLDLAYQVKILDHFSFLSRNKKTIVMSLHDVNWAARFCNHILLLFNDGKYLAGKKEDVLTKEHLSRLYSHPIEQILISNGLDIFIPRQSEYLCLK